MKAISSQQSAVGGQQSVKSLSRKGDPDIRGKKWGEFQSIQSKL
ncbi:MAG: hypothetical protein OXD49_08885 [Candidatus Poribacteria bacterium]|nr:hypothetical protein [Candidatus Poribacteria bacterium]